MDNHLTLEGSFDRKDLPNISVLTPTWNRQKFIKLMVSNLTSFIYPKEKMEWCILDDHPTNPLFEDNMESCPSIEAIKKLIHPIKLNYVYDKRKHLSIGEKRNRLVKQASYKLCANMDDDDIYFPEYLLYSYKVMKDNNAGLVGSPQMLFVFPLHNYSMSFIRCPSKRQAHEATHVFTKKFYKSMGGYEKSSQGEGAGIIDFNEKNVATTDVRRCMVCVCHSDNTCKKDRFLEDKVGDMPDDDPYKKLLKEIF